MFLLKESYDMLLHAAHFIQGHLHMSILLCNWFAYMVYQSAKASVCAETNTPSLSDLILSQPQLSGSFAH